ncbi:hypothetical protein Tco_1007860 [Tanacetum coccineum]
MGLFRFWVSRGERFGEWATLALELDKCYCNVSPCGVFIIAIQNSCSPSSIITAIESLSLSHHRMKIKRIAKVELLVYGVGFVMKVMGLFVGAEVEVRGKKGVLFCLFDWVQSLER